MSQGLPNVTEVVSYEQMFLVREWATGTLSLVRKEDLSRGGLFVKATVFVTEDNLIAGISTGGLNILLEDWEQKYVPVLAGSGLQVVETGVSVILDARETISYGPVRTTLTKEQLNGAISS